ncbi:hypothetical protein AB0M95_20695 [Sphaerisporangium sp. NPDC051017]|uniref:hypothetical protein n=1 Tax=Sphaerisporangium sp. NPDC051017 TaxID=3154636 RepID=UPI00342D8EAC
MISTRLGGPSNVTFRPQLSIVNGYGVLVGAACFSVAAALPESDPDESSDPQPAISRLNVAVSITTTHRFAFGRTDPCDIKSILMSTPKIRRDVRVMSASIPINRWIHQA